jgi:signal transduction histidine kinase
MMRGRGIRNHINHPTQLAPDLPRVPADRVQVQQVLMNLMLN